MISQLDPCSLYDGRMRDGKRPISIPSVLNQKNTKLDEYIQRHKKEDIQHETLLPSILNNHYYGQVKKTGKHSDKVLLNRL